MRVSGREVGRVTENAVIAATVSIATTAATASVRASGFPRSPAPKRGANSLGASNTIVPSVFHVPSSGRAFGPAV
jgi:hypothetical protein